MNHTLQKFVFLFINVAATIIATFDLWMSKGALNTFALVIDFLTLNWELKHVAIGLFEAKGISRVDLVGQLQALFEEYKLTNKIICHMKYEGTNLSTRTNVLNRLLFVKNWECRHHLKVFVLVMPFLRLANMPLLMKK